MKTKRIIALALVLLMAASLVACAGNTGKPTGTAPTGSAATSKPATTQAAAAPVEIRVNFDNISLSGIDPVLSTSTNITHLDMMFNSLMRIDEKTLKPVPDLADSVKVSDDGLVYTFALKKGVKFHRDYGEMTADDVVFSLLRSRDDPKSQPTNTTQLKVMKEVKAVDPYTVQITLSTKTPDFLYYMSDELAGAMITSKKAFEKIGAEGFAKTDAGTGPYVFDETKWVPQQSSHFIAFKDYFKGPLNVNVTITEIKDGSTALLAMQKGESDFLLSSQLEIITQAESAGMKVDFFKAPIYYGFFFNGDVYAPFKNDNVRKALFMVINRDNNRKAVFGDKMAREMKGVMPEVLPGFTMDGVETIEYNPEKAKQMLKDAGFENKIEFTATIQNNVRNQRIYTLLQQDFAKIGVKMNIKEVSTTEYYSAEEKRQVACSYSSVTGMPNMYFIMKQNFRSGELRDYSDYKGIDALIDKMAVTPDGPDRDKLFKDAQVQLSKDMPYFPLHAVNVIMVHTPRVQGIYSKGANGGDVRFDKVTIAK